MATFAKLVDTERGGRCKALHYDRHVKSMTRCDAATQRSGHPYCYNCWLDLSAADWHGFPPTVGDRETRVAIGEQTIFPLTHSQMKAYVRPASPIVRIRPKIPAAASAGIGVSVRGPDPRWKKADDAHVARGLSFSVYVIRAENGGLYVGQTRKEPATRFQEHADGKGSAVLRKRGVIGKGPVYTVQVNSRQLAMELEKTLHEGFRRMGLVVSMGEDED